MDLLLFIIGVIGGAVFLGWLAAALIRKTPKKTALIGLGVCVVLAITGLFVGDSGTTDQQVQAPPSEQQETTQDDPVKEVVSSEREKDLEAKYHDQIKSQSVRMENAGKELGRLFKSTEVNDAWFVDLLSEAMIMENVVKEAREMEAPEKFTVAHTEYLKGIEYAGVASDSFKAVANSFNLGADEIKMLEDGAGNLTKSAEHINKFKKEIENASY